MQLITTLGTKEFFIIPREYASAVTVNLINESTKVVLTDNVLCSQNGNYLTFEADFGTLKEGEFYKLEVLQDADLIYTDKVFCTNQSTNQNNNEYYSINKNQYVEKASDNDYIIF